MRYTTLVFNSSLYNPLSGTTRSIITYCKWYLQCLPPSVSRSKLAIKQSYLLCNQVSDLPEHCCQIILYHFYPHTSIASRSAHVQSTARVYTDHRVHILAKTCPFDSLIFSSPLRIEKAWLKDKEKDSVSKPILLSIDTKVLFLTESMEMEDLV